MEIFAKDMEKILLDEEAIRQRVKEMGRQITENYKGSNLLVVGVLKGAAVFFSDLIRAIELPVQIDFIAVSSYGAGTKSSGEVRMMKDLDVSLEDRDVLLVEDILDTGLTLKYLVEIFRSRGPKSLALCTFLDKTERRLVDIRADYVGFEIPDAFVVGYGLDYNQKYRNMRDIGILKPSVYEKKKG